jgi:hypothetical protein
MDQPATKSWTCQLGELLALVWTVPMQQLQKDFGISDVALKKRLDARQVLRPSARFWSRKAAGYLPKYPRITKLELQREVTMPVPIEFDFSRLSEAPAYKDALAKLCDPPAVRVLYREQLYQLVWAIEPTKLHRALEFSPEELQQICRQYDIPAPTRREWSSMMMGQAITRPPLPPGAAHKIVAHVGVSRAIDHLLTRPPGNWASASKAFPPVGQVPSHLTDVLARWQRRGNGNARRILASREGALEGLRLFSVVDVAQPALEEFLADLPPDTSLRNRIRRLGPYTSLEAGPIASSLQALSAYWHAHEGPDGIAWDEPENHTLTDNTVSPDTFRKDADLHGIGQETGDATTPAAGDGLPMPEDVADDGSAPAQGAAELLTAGDDVAAAFLEWMAAVAEPEWMLLRDLAIGLLMRDSGLSIAGAVSIRNSGYDPAKGRITYEGRLDKLETADLSDRALVSLVRYNRARPPSRSEMLFENELGKAYSDQAFRRSFSAYLVRAGIPDFPLREFWLPGRHGTSA